MRSNKSISTECPFCEEGALETRIIFKDNLVVAFPTNIPITPGHILISPNRHVSNIDELTDEELKALRNLIVKIKHSLKKSLYAEGFNIAWNEGEVAGQSVNHLHIHIVPRKMGDTGIHEYDPRKFLYRSGSRNESPDSELREIAKLVRHSM